MVSARILNYRGGKHTEYPNQYLLEITGIDSKEKAAPYLGKSVSWKTQSGKVITGKVSKLHGNKGVVLARFDKGLPGQALGTDVEIA